MALATLCLRVANASNGTSSQLYMLSGDVVARLHEKYQKSNMMAITGFTQFLEIMENLENHKEKFHA